MSSQLSTLADAIAAAVNKKVAPLAELVKSLSAEVEALKAVVERERESTLRAVMSVRLEDMAAVTAQAVSKSVEVRMRVLEGAISSLSGEIQRLENSLRSALSERGRVAVEVPPELARLPKEVEKMEQVVKKMQEELISSREVLREVVRAGVREALSQVKLEVPKEVVDLLKEIVNANAKILERLDALENAMAAVPPVTFEEYKGEEEEEEEGRRGRR